MNVITLSEIIVPELFRQTKPSKQKLDKVRAYVIKHGELDKPIVLDGRMITDNYIRYLVAAEVGLDKVPYITTQEYKEQRVEDIPKAYIIGKFKNCEKEYVWKVTKNISLEVGDRVLVCSKGGKGVVTVAQIFTSDSVDMLRHKPVIKKLKASALECQG